MAAILTALEPRDVLFVDEIHRLNRAVEEILYPALEDFRLDIVVGQGPAARTLTLDLPPFTLVGATTRTGLLTTPLRDRFGMTFRLGYYEPERARDDRPPLGADPRRRDRRRGGRRDRARARAARRGSRTGSCAASATSPRCATRARSRPRSPREALELLEVDEQGLERTDRELLEAIALKFGGGPVGLSTLAVALGEEPDTIEDVYEPYLLQLGFLQRTPRGRVITELGRAHVGAARAGREPLLMSQLWTPGMAGPLDELVDAHHRATSTRSRASTGSTVPVSVELADGRCTGSPSSRRPEPGFGFFTLVPARRGGRASRACIVRSARSARSGWASPSRRGARASAVECRSRMFGRFGRSASERL